MLNIAQHCLALSRLIFFKKCHCCHLYNFLKISGGSNFDSFLCVGQHFEKISVTFNGNVLVFLSREEFTKAHALQFGCLYVFGTSYEHGNDGKLLPKKVRNFYDFITYYIWGIRQKSVSSGTGAFLIKRVNADILKLWNLCSKGGSK